MQLISLMTGSLERNPVVKKGILVLCFFKDYSKKLYLATLELTLNGERGQDNRINNKFKVICITIFYIMNMTCNKMVEPTVLTAHTN